MRGTVRRRVLAIAAVLAAGVLVGSLATSAQAAEYPTWSDVQNARKSAKAKAAEVAKITALVTESKRVAAAAAALERKRGAEYQALRDRVDAAKDQLDATAKDLAADRKAAKEARLRAAQLVAQLSRSGGTDLQTSLFLDGSASDGAAETFLSRLGRLAKLSESNGALAAAATKAQNTAAATQARFVKATQALTALRGQAEVALKKAVAASDAAEARVASERKVQVTLAAQLQALKAKSDSELAGYRKGVAAKLAAGSGGAGTGGTVAASGWALPASGSITDGFGPRPNGPEGAQPFHRGTDIGAACSSGIYAAHSGTVVYAGWYGTYGYFVEISHGNGISTGYAHIRSGGTFVHVGQHVTAGQNIAQVGSTGLSTGCHLHFEVRINETAVNAVPFMAARGVTLG